MIILLWVLIILIVLLNIQLLIFHAKADVIDEYIRQVVGDTKESLGDFHKQIKEDIYDVWQSIDDK